MANERLDGANVIRQFLGKGKRFSDQTRYPLSQGTVKSLDVIGNAPLLFDDPMLLVRNDTLVCLPSVCIERGMLPVALWYQLPKGFGTLTTAVSDMECDERPTFDRHSYPYPLFVCFVTDETEHLIDF